MISIVVPAYNEEEKIADCLASLRDQTTATEYEVIVVDNNSTDATVTIARTFEDSMRLRIISEKVQGRGAARKTGWEAAVGDIVFSTDADATVPPNWIDTFLKVLEQNPDVVGVCGPVRINDCGRLRNMVFNISHPIFMRWYRVFFGHYLLCGFSFALKKSAYENSGGFDASNNGQEDVDLSGKIGKIGTVSYCKLPVLFSGRRFRGRFFKGVWEYLYAFFNIRIRGKTDVSLPDHR